jgi:hypothetical protein
MHPCSDLGYGNTILEENETSLGGNSSDEDNSPVYDYIVVTFCTTDSRFIEKKFFSDNVIILEV